MRPVFASVQPICLFVQTGRIAIPERARGMPWQGLQVSRECGESFVLTTDEGLAV